MEYDFPVGRVTLGGKNVDLSDIIPARDYEFRMGLRRGDAAEFFRATPNHREIIGERSRWLDDEPHRYAGLAQGSECLIEPLVRLFGEWGAFRTPNRTEEILSLRDPSDQLRQLGASLEPDILFLAPGEGGTLALQALCVCFPSSWAPGEKLGRRMDFIHDPAPGLNRSLGAQIDTFLSRLQPGVGWFRYNWGLSASPERNQHPIRALPRLPADAALEQTWLRVEHQCLVALPARNGVLFGLRVESVNLAAIRSEAREIAGRLAHALRTMPEDIAHYKGLAVARQALIEQLMRE